MDLSSQSLTREHWPGAAVTERSITVLGSTGSVGCNTLDLVERARRSGQDRAEAFPIEALTAHKNVELLIEQARKIPP